MFAVLTFVCVLSPNMIVIRLFIRLDVSFIYTQPNARARFEDQRTHREDIWYQQSLKPLLDAGQGRETLCLHCL